MFYSVKEICWRINMNTYSLKIFSFFLDKVIVLCYNKKVLNRKLFDLDAMMIRKQPKNSELLCVILLVMD